MIEVVSLLVRLIRLSLALLCLYIPTAIADSHGEFEAVSTEDSSFEYFDGNWGVALGFEFTDVQEFDTGDLSWALIVGKDFYRNDDITLGGQLHFSSSLIDDISAGDEVARDSTNLFATSHFNGFSALKFKLGLSYTRLDTFFGRESDTGMIYGIDLALSGRRQLFTTLLSYEESISGAEYQALFFNLFIFLH